MAILKFRLAFGQKVHEYAIKAHSSRSVSEVLKKIAEWFIKEVSPDDANIDLLGNGNYK